MTRNFVGGSDSNMVHGAADQELSGGPTHGHMGLHGRIGRMGLHERIGYIGLQRHMGRMGCTHKRIMGVVRMLSNAVLDMKVHICLWLCLEPNFYTL